LLQVFQRVAQWKMNAMGTGVLDGAAVDVMSSPQGLGLGTDQFEL